MNGNPAAKSLCAIILGMLFLLSGEVSAVLGQEASESSPAAPSAAPDARRNVRGLSLSGAAMCEKIDNLLPVNKAVTFPVSIGQIYCLTNFDSVSQETLIYHRWFHLDDLNAQVRLRIHPPQWTTFSTMQLRETDKGPWRVEVADQDGRILTTLRFSITD